MRPTCTCTTHEVGKHLTLGVLRANVGDTATWIGRTFRCYAIRNKTSFWEIV